MIFVILLVNLILGLNSQDLNIPPGQLKAVNINGTEIIWEFNTNGVIAFCITNANPAAGCDDVHEGCNKRAEYGECFIKPVYMLTYCKASCQVCPRGFRNAKGFGRCVTEIEIKEIPAEPAYFTEWSNWSSCTGLCEEGRRNRTRKCIYPKKDSRKCTGARVQVNSCKGSACPAGNGGRDKLFGINLTSRRSCGNTEFKCSRSTQCILGIQKCDGFDDCGDGSDEKDCPRPTAASTFSYPIQRITNKFTSKRPRDISVTTTPIPDTRPPSVVTRTGKKEKTIAKKISTNIPSRVTTPVTQFEDDFTTGTDSMITDTQFPDTQSPDTTEQPTEPVTAARTNPSKQIDDSVPFKSVESVVMETSSNVPRRTTAPTTAYPFVIIRPDIFMPDDTDTKNNVDPDPTKRDKMVSIDSNELDTKENERKINVIDSLRGRRIPVVKAQLILGEWSEWSSFGICSKTCGGGLSFRSRKCRDNRRCPATWPPGGTAKFESEQVDCNQDVVCPDQISSEWNDWTECSKSCGLGTMIRTRVCTVENNCFGPENEEKACNVKPCEGGWSEWETWGECSKTCGGGVHMRTRTCKNGVCIGITKDEKPCVNDPCKEFSEWETWSKCSKTCGGGFHMRTRLCNKVDGSCDGKTKEQKSCVNDFCKGIKGVGKAQDLVKKIIEDAFKGNATKKKPSGKYYKALLDLLKLIAEEFSKLPRQDSETQLNDLEQVFLNIAKKGKFDFARRLLAKILVMYNKLKMKAGIAIDDYGAIASKYVSKMKADVGDGVFDKIMGNDGDVTLMFAIDTTGSMQPEIDAAKAIAHTIINSMGSDKVDYILSPFNDPGAGPITYKSSKDKEGFVDAIGNLTVLGGGDCPEMSITGILNALEKGPRYSSPMFVFTDASAKDDTDDKMAAVREAATQLGVSISFFTRKQGCFGVQRGGIRSYRNIAAHTSGQIFPIVNTDELIEFTNYTLENLVTDTDINAADSFPNRYRRRYRRSVRRNSEHGITIDDGLQKLVVSVTTEWLRDNKNVKLYDPDGNLYDPTTVLELARIYVIDNPTYGTWTLNIPSYVRHFKYIAQGVSNDPIEFTHNFIYAEDRYEAFTLANPIKGVENKILVRLGGVERLIRSSLVIDLVDARGDIILRDLELMNVDDVETLYAYFFPPSEPFKVKLRGTTKTGFGFERISRHLNSAKSAFMRPKRPLNDTIIQCGGGTVKFPFEIFNYGDITVIDFRINALIGEAFPPEELHVVGKRKSITFYYTPPSDMTRCNRAERITISAKRRHSDEEFNFSISVLLT